MQTIIQKLIEIVEDFNMFIVEELDSKNISNTREAANSLRVDYGEDFVNSIGIFYLEFLDTGRAPGKYPPIEPLKEWAKSKFGVDDDEATSIAFAVANKIKNLGTEIFLNHGKGIELDKKIVLLRQTINEEIPKYAVQEIRQVLDRFKKIYEFNL